MSHATDNENPFKLAVPDADIDLLQRRLELVRFPDELEGAGWDYGSPLADVKRLAAHWMNGFDWRKAEAEINKLPMFTRDIEVDGFGTLNIHYVHQVSAVKGAIPLLFVHGCECGLLVCCNPFWRVDTFIFRAWTFLRGPKDSPAVDFRRLGPA